MRILRDVKSVSKCLVVLAVIALAVPGFSGLSSAVQSLSTDTVKTVAVDPWTIALYIDADNNLEACYDQFTLPFLLNIADNDQVNIVAWVDRLSTTGYEIVEFSAEDTVITACGTELGFGLSATLTDFIQWSTSTYPSENYCLVLWDHGSAWKGFLADDTDGSRMYGPDFDKAVKDAGVQIDVLGVDACSMSSMERMYEFSASGYIDIMVASEELVPGNGFSYDLMFAPVVSDPTRTPKQLSVDMVLGWEAYYGASQRVNLAAVNLHTYRAALDEFVAWNQEMIDGLEIFAKAYNRAAKHSYQVSGSVCQIDMLQFAQLLYEELGKYPATAERTALSDATNGVINAFGPSVLAISTGSVARETRGISIWFGWGGTYDMLFEYYSTKLWFTADMQWDGFLAEFNA